MHSHLSWVDIFLYVIKSHFNVFTWLVVTTWQYEKRLFSYGSDSTFDITDHSTDDRYEFNMMSGWCFTAVSNANITSIEIFCEDACLLEYRRLCEEDRATAQSCWYASLHVAVNHICTEKNAHKSSIIIQDYIPHAKLCDKDCFCCFLITFAVLSEECVELAWISRVLCEGTS